MDSTYKDNNKKFPLLEITATMNEMSTFLIIQVLLPEESAELLLWIFKEVCLFCPFHLMNRLARKYLTMDVLHQQ